MNDFLGCLTKLRMRINLSGIYISDISHQLCGLLFIISLILRRSPNLVPSCEEPHLKQSRTKQQYGCVLCKESSLSCSPGNSSSPVSSPVSPPTDCYVSLVLLVISL